MTLAKFQGPAGIIPEDNDYQATNSTAAVLKPGTVMTFDLMNESGSAGSTNPDLDTYAFEHLMIAPTIVPNGADPDVAVPGGTWPTCVVTATERRDGYPNDNVVVPVGDRCYYRLEGVVQAYLDYTGGTVAVDTYCGIQDSSVALTPTGAGLGVRSKFIARVLEASPNGVQAADTQVASTDSTVASGGEAVYQRAAGDWAADGFEAGDVVWIAGYAATAQNRAWIVKAVTSTDLTVYDPRNVTITEAVGAGQTVTKLTTKVWVEFQGVEGLGYELS